jgi:hypothetical protein
MMRSVTDTGPTNGDVKKAEESWDESQELTLFYGGSIVVQLGAQLYPSVTASVAELISNAWDADARNVWVTVPLEDAWHPDATIEVLDDGLGMTRRDAQFQYLVVGRERRRIDRTDETPRHRKLHGRKGIGKLAAFGTGHLLEVVTKRAGATAVGFRLDYKRLRDHEPGQSSPVEELIGDDIAPLCRPDGQLLDHGTRVRLTSLQNKRRPNPARLMTSMRRRFALDEREMRVEINGEPLTRFDMDFPLRFPRDGAPGDCEGANNDFIIDLVDDGAGGKQPVKWWIGFTDKPVKEENLQGVTVLVRGKQAQHAFKFERTGGTGGQLGFEYLVGEVHADWIDDGWSDDGDLISSDRDTLQLEDERLQPFVEWGRGRLRWATREWEARQRSDRTERWRTDMPQVASVLGHVTVREQQNLGRVAERLSRVEGIQDSDIAEVMGRVLQAREHRTASEVAEEIRSVGDASSEDTWSRAHDARDIEERTLKATVDVRLAVLDNLLELLADAARPPRLAEAIANHPWIVDLAFDRSTVQRLPAPEGDAVLVVGAPPWEPTAGATLVAATWPADLADIDYEAWLTAIDAIDLPQAVGRRMLVGPRAEAPSVVSWKETLGRSVAQHVAWSKVLGGAER